MNFNKPSVFIELFFYHLSYEIEKNYYNIETD